MEKVQSYFDELKEAMEQWGFSGCPFSNTSTSMGSEEVPDVQEQITLHKHFVCDFFVQLSEPFTKKGSEAEWLGRSLFLIYSGATTESKNLKMTWPIEHAAGIAIQLCKGVESGKLQPY